MTQALYHAARENILFCGPRPFSALFVSGEDPVSFLHNILTQDIKGMRTGDWREAALLSATSHVLNYFTVIRFETAFLLICAPDQSSRLRGLLEKFIIAEDVRIKDADADWVLFEAWGPDAEKIAADGNGNAHFEPARKNFPRRLLFSAPTQADFSKSGLLGDESLREILRIENGILQYGVDFNETHMLSETGLEKIAASATKGCYPGQEVVAKIETYKRLNRSFVRLAWEQEEMPARGAVILDQAQKEEIGFLTSRTYSPFLKKSVGLGWLKRSFFEKPGEVFIEARTRIRAQFRAMDL